MNESPHLVKFLQDLEHQFCQAEASEICTAVHEQMRSSAKNLYKYLILRSYDMRQAQQELHHLGLSSLAAAESHIHYQLSKVLGWLCPEYISNPCSIDDFTGRKLIADRAEMLFGPKNQPTETPYLMVTIDEKAFGDPRYFDQLLLHGMNVARINFAHTDEATARSMIAALRESSARVGIACKIYMDLAGPKIRTVIPGNKKKIKIQAGEIVNLCTLNSEPRDKKTIWVSEASIFQTVSPGDRVFIDDGKFYGIVEKNDCDKVAVRILRTPQEKAEIKSDKGINLPDTQLNTPSLTSEDIKHLRLAGEFADLIGYSFVRKREDIKVLRSHMRELNIQVPVIYKIETSEAVENFPDLLIEAMREPLFGVMIARGDLAVEIGFERLAEIQEELLWLAEAAHIPMIWATQVLENLNKTGILTRSEISDAVMASMSECVMLNKGRNIHQTMRTLSDILQRETSHRQKKRFTMRSLSIAKRFLHKIQ
ncbi:pyruvate kinase [Schleiferia thermophila]|jgi:pyruvate kinase|uniref:pyruvate kinase n=1 Tax=Schleiferia thermophila TaxID=884107 RepID=UPI0005608C20|nr:pyruvate kinase [Schleiferia thermophila]